MNMEKAFGAIGALADPVRRKLYKYVVAQPDAVGREEAAAGVDVPVHSARFHLDKLVDEGLLEVEFRRLTGRTGPGAGRPAKLYHRAHGDVSVSVPERNYDLVGHVFAAAVQRSLDGAPLAQSLAEEAHEAGRRDGSSYDAAGSELERSAGALASKGFEPVSDGACITLRNCPFDALARQHTALVCGVNHDYVSGVVEGLGCRGLRADLDPGEDRCCVRISSRA